MGMKVCHRGNFASSSNHLTRDGSRAICSPNTGIGWATPYKVCARAISPRSAMDAEIGRQAV